MYKFSLKHDNISNWRMRVMCFCLIIMPDIGFYLFCQPSPTINSKTLQLENKRNILNHNIYQFCPLKIACVPLQFIYNQ